MCGIVGFVGLTDRPLLERMCRILTHRGPDDEGFFLEEGIGLGMRRLSIIDVALGHQPIANEDKTLWIVFNGEIYNYRELKVSLESRHRFSTETDTEVILHLYEEEGEACLQKLRGMFAFAIWDKRRRRLFLARDRLGIKPLYYLEKDGRFIFASEMKALLAWEGLSREVCEEALHEYLSFLYVPAPLTIMKGIQKLRPGHWLTFQNGRSKMTRYWTLPLPKAPGKKASSHEELMALLEETVQLHLRSDVPLGAFLSGGMDSSTLVGLMRRVGNISPKTFTIGYQGEYSSFNELDSARDVASYFGCDHHEEILNPDVNRIFPKMVWAFDEPHADSSAIPTYLISEVARKKVKVALSGIGGDELFGGYPRYLGVILSRFYRWLPFFMRRGIAGLTQVLPEGLQSRNWQGWVKRFTQGATESFEGMYLSWMTSLSDTEKISLYSPRLRQALSGIPSGRGHLEHFAQCRDQEALMQVLFLDLNTYLVDDLLMMGDKMSMASSLELRVPFCDHLLWECVAAIPFEEKLKGFRLKSLMKKTCSTFLPPQVLQKPKQGFMIPVGSWIRKELRGFVSDFLSRKRLEREGYFSAQAVEDLVKAHASGRRNLTDPLWSLLVFEMWYDQFIAHHPTEDLIHERKRG